MSTIEDIVRKAIGDGGPQLPTHEYHERINAEIDHMPTREFLGLVSDAIEERLTALGVDHDRRVIELLEANNRLLERARKAEAALRKISGGPTFALSEIGSDAVFMALNEAMKTANDALKMAA